MRMPETIIVVPCYNEAKRIPIDQFVDFANRFSDIDVLFVNDGSQDSTPEVLDQLVACDPKRFSVLDQRINRGKAEAVRVGMNEAFARGAAFAGYFDAATSRARTSPCTTTSGMRSYLPGRRYAAWPQSVGRSPSCSRAMART